MAEGTLDRPAFVRLQRGRVWHTVRGCEFVGPDTETAEFAWCGASWPVRHDQRPERLASQIPVGGRICWRCVVEVNLFRNTVLGVAVEQRRPGVNDLGSPVTESDTDDDGVVDAEIVDDEWPCGVCGHPNLDHDVDTAQCTVTDDSPDAEWAECPCRGLQPEA